MNLEASLQNDTEVVLEWKDISDDELGFNIQRAGTDSTFITIGTVGANVTAFTDTRPDGNRTVVYRVYAINSERTSIPSKPVTIELQ